MYRANVSFSCELSDGTERSFKYGDVATDDDPVVEAQPDYFTMFEPQPGAGSNTAKSTSRRSSAKA